MIKDSAYRIAKDEGVARRLLTTVHITPNQSHLAQFLRNELGHVAPEHLFVFATHQVELERICAVTDETFADASVTGCTTAGQIGAQGYEEQLSVVIALPKAHFATRTVVIKDIRETEPQALIDLLVQERTQLSGQHPDKPNGFGFLLVDGLSRQEDILAATIAPGMGAWPIFGGSSGDGTRFEKTHLARGSGVEKAIAILTFVRTDCETRVFSLNHLEPTDRKMIVTRADPEARIVKEINAEPAAREYARIVNKDPNQLDEFTFAAHPVVVRLGDTHHVRAIQRVNEQGELVFFSAIDEGMVLNVATPKDIAVHLESELAEMTSGRGSVDVFACDCLLRRMEASETQAFRAVSDVLSRNRVVGFSTYGEQIGPLHVNQTMTGVMLVNPWD